MRFCSRWVGSLCLGLCLSAGALAALELQKKRSNDDDLAITGPFGSIPAGETRYITRAELSGLAGFTKLREKILPNFPEAELGVLPLSALLALLPPGEGMDGLVLVCSDLRGVAAGRRSAGIGIGLAAAIKLTPAVFIGYLLLSRQYRAAATAAGTAAGATVLTAIVAPEPSRDFWTDALWDTGRVGRLEYVSNQSLRGVVARLEAPTTWWVAAVLLVLAYWAWWVRARRGPIDHAAGFAVTGIVACLISPITWVHHLVWVLPAMFWLLDRARLALTGVAYVLMSSSFVWMWWAHPFGWPAFPGANLYVWIAAGLMLTVSLTDQEPWSALRRGAAQRTDVGR